MWARIGEYAAAQRWQIVLVKREETGVLPVIGKGDFDAFWREGGNGARAGMRAAQEATHSNVPAISYPATFAISNVAFTLLCYVMALLDRS